MDVGDALIEALGLTPPAHVALVGGGGKTTLMLGLYRAGVERGWTAMAGTTTKVFSAQAQGVPGFLHARADGHKLIGLSPEAMDEAWVSGRFDLLAVEADGSRSKVVKAPNPTEPVIPSSVTHVLAVIGADGIDRVIEDCSHRPMRVAAVCGCGPYSRLTPERAARLLTSERGGRQHVPPAAQFAVVITRIGPRQVALAAALAALVTAAGVPVVQLPLL